MQPQKQHIHILGICGTFMAGIARIAQQLGYHVTGSDHNFYPPMSKYITQLKIPLINDEHELLKRLNRSTTDNTFIPDLILIGNTAKRGNPIIEFILDNPQKTPFQSAPQWLYETVLKNKHVIAVSGTHGKTTTTALLIHILRAHQLNPSYLIGGIVHDLEHSAHYSPLEDSKYFIIEADEYDTAFFDKRSKFMHYHPSTLIINNLEFDHADIFEDMNAIYKQFHHLIRTLPSKTHIIYPSLDTHIQTLLKMGCWSQALPFHPSESMPTIPTPILIKSLPGKHNQMNALAAFKAVESLHILPPEKIIQSLTNFKGVKRRLEIIHQSPQVTVYDDFAHHPTAIQASILALKAQHPEDQVIAILEPRSNTMKMGTHKNTLFDALQVADQTYIYQNKETQWSLKAHLPDTLKNKIHIYEDTDQISHALYQLTQQSKQKMHWLIMSNGSFNNIYATIKHQLGSIDLFDVHA